MPSLPPNGQDARQAVRLGFAVRLGSFSELLPSQFAAHSTPAHQVVICLYGGCAALACAAPDSSPTPDFPPVHRPLPLVLCPDGAIALRAFPPRPSAGRGWLATSRRSGVSGERRICGNLGHDLPRRRFDSGGKQPNGFQRIPPNSHWCLQAGAGASTPTRISLPAASSSATSLA